MGAAGWKRGAWGGLGAPLPHHIGALIPPDPFGSPHWQAKLPAGSIWTWRCCGNNSLPSGARGGNWVRNLEGGRLGVPGSPCSMEGVDGWEMGWGPIPALWDPLSLLPWGGNCAPLSPGHILPTELRHRASPWQRNLGYPLAMLGLLALTVSGPGLPGVLGVVLVLTTALTRSLLLPGHLCAHCLLPRPGAAAG